MRDVNRLVNEFDGQLTGGTVIVYEDGTHKEAARCVEGTWVIDPEFRARLDAPKRGRSKKIVVDEPEEAPVEDAPVVSNSDLG